MMVAILQAWDNYMHARNALENSLENLVAEINHLRSHKATLNEIIALDFSSHYPIQVAFKNTRQKDIFPCGDKNCIGREELQNSIESLFNIYQDLRLKKKQARRVLGETVIAAKKNGTPITELAAEIEKRDEYSLNVYKLLYESQAIKPETFPRKTIPLRNQYLARLHALGVPTKEISKEIGFSLSSIRNIIRDTVVEEQYRNLTKEQCFTKIKKLKHTVLAD